MEQIIDVLYEDLSYRMINDKTQYDEELEKYYFINVPGDFLPWTSRNKKFSNRIKSKMKDLLINNEIIFLHNMRWYINCATVRELGRKLNATIN